MTNIVCYTENQKKDYVTELVYNFSRVVHKDKENEHPSLHRPVFIHRDATFHASNYLSVTIKSSPCCEDSVKSLEIGFGKDMIIGSDEEQALVNAIASNFPASEHFLCTKHLKDGTRAYVQANVAQKDRKIITNKIFGENGIVNANDTAEFDSRSKKI